MFFYPPLYISLKISIFVQIIHCLLFTIHFPLSIIMKDSLVMKTLAIAIVYFLLRFMGGSFGQIILYPITLLVTFLHEFGHALGAGLTGGSIKGMTINTNGRTDVAAQQRNRLIAAEGRRYTAAVRVDSHTFDTAARQTCAESVTKFV